MLYSLAHRDLRFSFLGLLTRRFVSLSLLVHYCFPACEPKLLLYLEDQELQEGSLEWELTSLGDVVEPVGASPRMKKFF